LILQSLQALEEEYEKKIATISVRPVEKDATTQPKNNKLRVSKQIERENSNSSNSTTSNTSNASNNTSSTSFSSSSSFSSNFGNPRLSTNRVKKNNSYQKISSLFELCTKLVGIDVTLCADCGMKYNSTISAKLKTEKHNFEVYSQYFSNLSKKKEEQDNQLNSDVEELQNQEKDLIQKLDQIDIEKKQLDAEMKELEDKEKDLEILEKRYWENFNEFQTQSYVFNESFDDLKMKIIKNKSILEELQISNIFNIAFHIWFDGHFGTINNFRLGKLPSVPVDWNEINAAWGFATLCLYTLSAHFKYNFVTWRPLPMGSNSKMEKKRQHTNSL